MLNSTASARERFAQMLPGVAYLQATDEAHELEVLTTYLQQREWIASDESVISAEKAGEGNMNATVRVRTDQRSFILKQSRPWVEKYPVIDAPFDRALVEGRFYQTLVSGSDLVRFMPKLLGFDEAARLLMFEDLGPAQDFTHLYAGGELSESDAATLTRYLVMLHSADIPSREAFVNRDMRRLNHEHIFDLPLRQDNGLDLDRYTPGLNAAAAELKADAAYVERVRSLGERYLHDGPRLVHGDYFPGSWLRRNDQIYVIDPEFCFLGDAEFDIGVMLAHMHLARHPQALSRQVANDYGSAAPLDMALANAYAGVEIMRRLIGVAQLPLAYGIDNKLKLLDLSHKLVLA